MNEKNKGSYIKKAFNISLVLLVLLAFWQVLGVMQAAKNNELAEASILGIKPVLMKSETMKPDINPYDIAIVKLKDKAEDVNDGKYLYFTGNLMDRSIEKVVRHLSDGTIETIKSNKNKPSQLLLEDENILGEVLFVIPVKGVAIVTPILLLGLAVLNVHKKGDDLEKLMAESEESD